MRQIASCLTGWRTAVSVAAVLTLTGCAEAIGPSGEEPANSIERVSAAALEGAPGFPLSDSLVVKVVDATGAPVPGARVQFVVESGGGAASPEAVDTDEMGMARTRWVLGPTAGDGKVRAGVDGLSNTVEFTATARLGVERTLTAISGATTQMPVGCALPEPLTVKVTDSSGAPVEGAPVLFDTGDSAADGMVTLTNAEGIAAHSWRVGAATERVTARIAAPGSPTATFDVTGVPVAPGGFASVGPKIYSAGCAPHRFVGVARPGLQWWPDDERLSNAELAKAEFDGMKSWGANVVRIPLYQGFWLRDLHHEGVTYSAETYRKLIAASVERANAAGLAVIIDLHGSDRGDPNHPPTLTEIQQMADMNNSVPFWKSVAEMFKGNGSVLFQLYNEPNQIEWELWRDGGTVPAGETFPPQSSGPEFEAAGMQDLYKAIRDTGASNMVIVNGMHWGYNLSRLSEFALDGYNIIYATHPYDYPDKQPERWWADWGHVSQTYPLMIAEFGDYTCNSEGYYTKVLDYADEYNLSWVAWAWWAPPADQPDLICKFPALIKDWAGTPSPTGEVVRARMQSYR